jgi:hypothetical protein
MKNVLLPWVSHQNNAFQLSSTQNAIMLFALLVREKLIQMKEKCMKTINETEDELRPEYKRSDFGDMVRGKYAQRLTPKPI